MFLHTAPRPTDEEAEKLAARGIAVVEGEVASLEIVEDRLAGVRAGAAINADLIAEDAERAVTAYRARREARTAGRR